MLLGHWSCGYNPPPPSPTGWRWIMAESELGSVQPAAGISGATAHIVHRSDSGVGRQIGDSFPDADIPTLCCHPSGVRMEMGMMEPEEPIVTCPLGETCGAQSRKTPAWRDVRGPHGMLCGGPDGARSLQSPASGGLTGDPTPGGRPAWGRWKSHATHHRRGDSRRGRGMFRIPPWCPSERAPALGSFSFAGPIPTAASRPIGLGHRQSVPRRPSTNSRPTHWATAFLRLVETNSETAHPRVLIGRNRT